MLIVKPLSQTLLCAVILLTLPLSANSRDLYRYTNDEGNMVVDDRVPTEYVSRGYEVLNQKGVVIKVVPRELTEEELEQQGIQIKIAAAAVAEQERLRKWDESLLLRYSTIGDIEAARERALRDLRIRVSILKSNTRSLKQQVENYQTVAADIERSGGTVDLTRLKTIEELQSDIAITERSVIDRQAEVKRVQEDFELDIGRFEQLLEIVVLRRTLLETQE
jgi:hypothetical protein